MADEARWYVVHTYSGYENKVAATIEKTIENRKLHDLIFAVNIPTETVLEVRETSQKEVERKIFPGYVLVKMIMTDDSWHVVRNTRGVTGFVGPGSKPVALTDEEVAALGIDKREPKVSLSYKVGDQVRVTEGPITNFTGTVDEIDENENRVRVIVSMFGRETPVELELHQVTAI
ncbi:MAG: transcription termination/antitermination protein NusG [Ruminococcaceae bacterium]|nr:transcription termination/antitermination protein NusG [Oscillospiraceae bacterium]